MARLGLRLLLRGSKKFDFCFFVRQTFDVEIVLTTFAIKAFEHGNDFETIGHVIG